MFSVFKRKPSQVVARRLVELTDAHGVRRQEIPRLFPSVGYAHLDDPQLLLAAITPAVVDSAAELFGVRREFLEGLDKLAYLPIGSGRAPAAESTRILVNALAHAVESHQEGGGWMRGPLAVLATSAALDRRSPHQQWLVPVIVEPSGAELEGPLYRCRIFGGYFDWADADQRIGLKALAWLVWHRLGKVVPLYPVTESYLVDTLSGETVPSVALLRSVITNPSLEDFIEEAGNSAVAKEVDELPEVLAFLESSGLRAHWDAVSINVTPATPVATTTDPGGEIDGPSAAKASTARNGKRGAAEATKGELRAAAQVIWAQDSSATIASVIRQLKTMSHLRGAARSDSAIHKAISSVAPVGASRPGRRPKQSP